MMSAVVALRVLSAESPGRVNDPAGVGELVCVGELATSALATEVPLAFVVPASGVGAATTGAAGVLATDELSVVGVGVAGVGVAATGVEAELATGDADAEAGVDATLELAAGALLTGALVLAVEAEGMDAEFAALLAELAAA